MIDHEDVLRRLIELAQAFRGRGIYAEGEQLLDAAPAALDTLVARDVYILETGCYENAAVVGVFASAEAAMQSHAPKPPSRRHSDRQHSYEWASAPDERGMYHFGADWDDAATVSRWQVRS